MLRVENIETVAMNLNNTSSRTQRDTQWCDVDPGSSALQITGSSIKCGMTNLFHNLFSISTATADIPDNVCTGANVWCFAINDDGLVFTDPPSVNSYGPDLEKYLLNTQPHFLLEGFL